MNGVAILVYNLDPSGPFTTGGMERQAGLLAQALAARGRRVLVVTTVSTLNGTKLIERRGDIVIYRVPAIANRWCDWKTAQDLYETLAARIIARHRWVRAIYAVSAPSAGVHAARIAPVVGLPVVLKLACSGEAGDIRTAKRERGPEVFELLRRLDRIVVLNDASRREAISEAGLDPARVVHIPNGIDLARFSGELAPAALPELGPEPREVVLFVGRLQRQKRVDVLVEAFRKVAARRPRARLAIAGEGRERAAIEEKARGVATFLGLRQDVPALLRAARVFVLPSAEEGISNSLLEAMACAAPIVATDIAGNRDVARHEREALLVPPDDVEALAAAIERLLDDRALAEKLGAAARARVEQDYAIARVAEKYGELFDSLPAPAPPSFAGFFARHARSELRSLAWLLARGAARNALAVSVDAALAVPRAIAARTRPLREGTT